MKNKKEKTENRKALPKFLGWMVICGLVGGVVGVLAGIVGATNLPETVVQGIYQFLEIITPWSIWVISVILLGIGLMKYRAAKRLFTVWDGEDEEQVEEAEQQINWAILATSLLIILDFFFFGIGIQMLEGSLGNMLFLLSFIVSLAALIILQQKVVDLIRKINPEKQGSVYDMKFKTKWLDSCDENELRQIGQAAFKSFNAVTYICVGLWMVLMLMNYILDVGVLPFFLVMLIWGVSQVVYIVECIRLGRYRK